MCYSFEQLAEQQVFPYRRFTTDTSGMCSTRHYSITWATTCGPWHYLGYGITWVVALRRLRLYLGYRITWARTLPRLWLRFRYVIRIVPFHYILMESRLYAWSILDPNIIMWHVTVSHFYLCSAFFSLRCMLLCYVIKKREWVSLRFFLPWKISLFVESSYLSNFY